MGKMMNKPFFIRASGSTDGDGVHKIEGVAYDGGKLKLGPKDPIIVDVEYLDCGDKVPLLVDHENKTHSRIGLLSASVSGGEVVVSGEIFSKSETAQDVIAQGVAGADWQMSIGASADKVVFVSSGSREINNQTHTAPFYHVTASTLKEVSVVPIGAAKSTHMTVLACLNLTGGKNMVFIAWLKAHGLNASLFSEGEIAELKAAHEAGQEVPEKFLAASAEPTVAPVAPVATVQASAPVVDVQAAANVAAVDAVKAERARVSAIEEVCAGDHADIKAAAIADGSSADDVAKLVLTAIRASRPNVPNVVGTTLAGVETIEAALMLRSGASEKEIVDDFSEEVLEAAMKERGISLPDVFRACAANEGIHTGLSFGNDNIQAGFSTTSLPGMLNNVANKKLLRSYNSIKSVAPTLCSSGELADFKQSERYRLTDVGNLTKVAPSGEIEHGTLSEEMATNQLETYGKMFGLTRKHIYDDDLNGFLKIPGMMGARAARLVDQLFFERLLQNPGGLFSVGNKNYLGSGSALSAASLSEAVTLFQNQTDSDGQPISVAPKYLLVPSSLRTVAREILNSTYLLSVGSTDATHLPTYNAAADEGLTLITSPYLENANYGGASQTGWYLFGDSAMVDTFEIGYLKGARTPTIERANSSFDTLGIQFRVYFDLGIREQDFRGMTFATGTA